MTVGVDGELSYLSINDWTSSKAASCRSCEASSSSLGFTGTNWAIKLSMACETRLVF